MNRLNKESEAKLFMALLLAALAGMLMGRLFGKKTVNEGVRPCKRFVCSDDFFDCDDCLEDDDYDCE